jgi:excisionase family DNA binding protein
MDTPLTLEQKLAASNDAIRRWYNGDERETMTVEEAAKRLGISRDSAYKAVHAGEIPSIRIGRKLLIPKSAFAAMLAGET